MNNYTSIKIVMAGMVMLSPISCAKVGTKAGMGGNEPAASVSEESGMVREGLDEHTINELSRVAQNVIERYNQNQEKIIQIDGKEIEPNQSHPVINAHMQYVLKKVLNQVDSVSALSFSHCSLDSFSPQILIPLLHSKRIEKLSFKDCGWNDPQLDYLIKVVKESPIIALDIPGNRV